MSEKNLFKCLLGGFVALFGILKYGEKRHKAGYKEGSIDSLKKVKEETADEIIKVQNKRINDLEKENKKLKKETDSE